MVFAVYVNPALVRGKSVSAANASAMQNNIKTGFIKIVDRGV